MFYELMEKLCRKCHENSKSKGFWDEGEQYHDEECSTTGGSVRTVTKRRPWNFAEKIALVHSELSEALEAHREGNPFSKKLNRAVPDEYVGGTGYKGSGFVHPVNEHLAPYTQVA